MKKTAKKVDLTSSSFLASTSKSA